MGQIVDDRELVTLVEADRAAGRTIAFANGCFDVLHVGHVRYLRGARREADRLVVAINSDVSERRLKGPGRPILDEATRAEVDLSSGRRGAKRLGAQHKRDGSGPLVDYAADAPRPLRPLRGTGSYGAPGSHRGARRPAATGTVPRASLHAAALIACRAGATSDRRGFPHMAAADR